MYVCVCLTGCLSLCSWCVSVANITSSALSDFHVHKLLAHDSNYDSGESDLRCRSLVLIGVSIRCRQTTGEALLLQLEIERL